MRKKLEVLGYQFKGLNLGVSIWTFFSILEISFRNENLILIFDNIQFLGIDFVSFFGILFGLNIGGNPFQNNKKIYKFFILFCILHQVIIWTDPITHLIRKKNIFYEFEGLHLLRYEYGAWLSLYSLIVISSLIFLVIYITYKVVKSRGIKRKQLAVFLVGILIPLLGGIATTVNLVPIIHPAFDISPFLFIFMEIIFILGINFYKVFDLIPYGRDTAFELLNDPALIIYRNQIIADANIEARKLLGDSNTNYMGKSLTEYIPELSQITSWIIKNRLEFYEWKLTQKKKDIYYEVNVKQLATDSENPSYLIMLKEVTLRKWFEESAIQERNLLDLILNSTGVLYMALDSEDRIAHFNIACEKTFGYKKDELIGKNFWEVLPIQSEKILSSSDLLRKTSILQGTWISNNSEKIEIYWEINQIYNSELKNYFYIFTGKHIEENLETGLKIRSLENAIDEIRKKNKLIEEQKITLEQAFVKLQEAQAQLISVEKMAALGQLIAGIAHEINNPIGAIKASNDNLNILMEEMNLSSETFLRKWKTGANDFQEIYKTLVQNMNIDAQLQTQKEFRKLRREFTEWINSFGVKNADILADKLLELGYSLRDEKVIKFITSQEGEYLFENLYLRLMVMKNIKNIKIAVDKSSKMMFALKSYARIKNDTPLTKMSIRETIETVLTIYQNYFREVEIIRNYHTDIAIYCYPEELFHLWTNLILNALQAMKFKGKIEIVTQEMDDKICVEITDNGPGIPIEIQNRVFDPFFTTKPVGEGTGLGLDISKKIIQRHSGTIQLQSEPGRTTFQIFLPKLT
jgi:signal transduction histidine kinase